MRRSMTEFRAMCHVSRRVTPLRPALHAFEVQFQPQTVGGRIVSLGLACIWLEEATASFEFSMNVMLAK